MQAQGIRVISFGAGEPDFDTPAHIKQAAIQAIHEGFTKYTAVGGIDELKDAVIAKFQRDNHLTYKRSQVLVSCGGKHSFYNLTQAIFEEGDQVIIPSPYWVSYPPMVALTGATPSHRRNPGAGRFQDDGSMISERRSLRKPRQ